MRLFVAFCSAALFALGISLPAHAQIPPEYLKPKYIAPTDASADIVVAEKGEPGERMIVTGQITDGKVPLSGVSIYVFQADAKGYYAPLCRPCDTAARLRGAMRSDANGHYRYDTVRPGSYGGAAHVHYVVSAPGYRPRMAELRFEDDPKAKAGLSSNAFPNYIFAVRPVSRDAQGTWHCTLDVVMEPN